MDVEWKKSGRRARGTPEEYVAMITKYKDTIVWEQKVVPASCKIWSEIAADDLNGRVKGDSVNSLTVSNRHGLLDVLFDRPSDKLETSAIDSSLEFDDSFNTTIDSINSTEKCVKFTITFGKPEFQDLITETSSIVKDEKKSRQRKYTV